jgi:hypothetical protein
VFEVLAVQLSGRVHAEHAVGLAFDPQLLKVKKQVWGEGDLRHCWQRWPQSLLPSTWPSKTHMVASFVSSFIFVQIRKGRDFTGNLKSTQRNREFIHSC